MSTPDRAEALLNTAIAKVRQGDLGGAAQALEQAAAVQAQAGRPQDQARSLQLAAALRGAAGDTTASRLLAEQAAAVQPGDLPVEVASLAQRAEAESAGGHFREAARLYADSLAKAQQARLGPDVSIALLRQRAGCLIADGCFAEGDDDFAAACRLAAPRIADFLRTEHARLLIDAGEFDKASAVLPAGDAQDPQLMAEIFVERARLDRAAGHLDKAGQYATDACAMAREAIAPVPYFAASVELAEVFDALGRRADAYASLTTAWGTLSDLLGRDVARSWVEPCLLALQLRWGDAAFAAIKRAHDEQRRSEREKNGEGTP